MAWLDGVSPDSCDIIRSMLKSIGECAATFFCEFALAVLSVGSLWHDITVLQLENIEKKSDWYVFSFKTA